MKLLRHFSSLHNYIKCRKWMMHRRISRIFSLHQRNQCIQRSGDRERSYHWTCEGKMEEMKQRWSKALAHVATIEEVHTLDWADEAEMIRKITTDVSNKLNLTPSDYNDFWRVPGPLNDVYSLLCLKSTNDVKMIGIWGPTGSGKNSIAGALYEELSTTFELKCFIGNLKGRFKSLVGSVDSKLQMQSKLLSEIFNQKDMQKEIANCKCCRIF